MIAIIAILAAILFPVFARAREKARQATCLSNTKQIGLGVMQYVQDYDECFPNSKITYPPDGSDGSTWWAMTTLPMMLQPYMKSWGVWSCPSQLDPAVQWYTDSGAPSQYSCAYPMHYSFNSRVHPPTGGWYWHDWTVSYKGTRKLAQIAEPASTISGYCIRPSTPGISLYGDFADWLWIRYSTYTGYYGSPSGYDPAATHIEGSSYWFCDGHSKWLKCDKMPEQFDWSSPAGQITNQMFTYEED